MATRKQQKVTSPWSKAISEVLGAAGVTQTRLAQQLDPKRVDSERVSIVRFLNGGRLPSAESVKRINRAIAELSGHPHVEAYLDFQATHSRAPLEKHEALAKAASWCLRWYGRFFERRFIERILSTLNETEARGLVRDLNRALQRIIISDLLPPSRPFGLKTILDALAKNGTDVTEVVSELGTRQIAWESFVHTVQHELYLQNRRTPARERLAATERILNCLVNPDALGAIEVSIDSRGLLELKTVVNGKTVSRFF